MKVEARGEEPWLTLRLQVRCDSGGGTLICSPKIGPFKARVFRGSFLWLGGAEMMKASQFSEAQKAFILKQGNDGVPVAEICRKAGISPATYFNWKKKYDGLRRRRCGD